MALVELVVSAAMVEPVATAVLQPIETLVVAQLAAAAAAALLAVVAAQAAVAVPLDLPLVSTLSDLAARWCRPRLERLVALGQLVKPVQQALVVQAAAAVPSARPTRRIETVLLALPVRPVVAEPQVLMVLLLPRAFVSTPTQHQLLLLRQHLQRVVSRFQSSSPRLVRLTQMAPL